MALRGGISTWVPEGERRITEDGCDPATQSRLQSLGASQGRSNTFFVSFRGRMASKMQSVTIAEMESRARRRQRGVCEEERAAQGPGSGRCCRSRPGQLPWSPNTRSSCCDGAGLGGGSGPGGPGRSGQAAVDQTAAAPRSLPRSLGKARRSRHRSRADATLSGRPRPPRRLPPGSSPKAHGPRPPGLSWQQLHH